MDKLCKVQKNMKCRDVATLLYSQASIIYIWLHFFYLYLLISLYKICKAQKYIKVKSEITKINCGTFLPIFFKAHFKNNIIFPCLYTSLLVKNILAAHAAESSHGLATIGYGWPCWQLTKRGLLRKTTSPLFSRPQLYFWDLPAYLMFVH